MSLIDSGPDQIEWRQEIVTQDAYGTPVHAPGPDVLTFTAQVQRSTSEDAELLGQDVLDVHAFNTSQHIWGAHSGLTVNGRTAKLTRPPQAQGRSARTRHVRVYFRYVTEGA